MCSSTTDSPLARFVPRNRLGMQAIALRRGPVLPLIATRRYLETDRLADGRLGSGRRRDPKQNINPDYPPLTIIYCLLNSCPYVRGGRHDSHCPVELFSSRLFGCACASPPRALGSPFPLRLRLRLRLSVVRDRPAGFPPSGHSELSQVPLLSLSFFLEPENPSLPMPSWRQAID